MLKHKNIAPTLCNSGEFVYKELCSIKPTNFFITIIIIIIITLNLHYVLLRQITIAYIARKLCNKLLVTIAAGPRSRPVIAYINCVCTQVYRRNGSAGCHSRSRSAIILCAGDMRRIGIVWRRPYRGGHKTQLTTSPPSTYMVVFAIETLGNMFA